MDSLFVNNALCKAIMSLVNFCNEQSNFYRKELKFLKNKPLNKVEIDGAYKTKFIFDTNRKIGVDYK